MKITFPEPENLLWIRFGENLNFYDYGFIHIATYNDTVNFDFESYEYHTCEDKKEAIQQIKEYEINSQIKLLRVFEIDYKEEKDFLNPQDYLFVNKNYVKSIKACKNGIRDYTQIRLEENGEFIQTINADVELSIIKTQLNKVESII
jgi:hypothetical protein